MKQHEKNILSLILVYFGVVILVGGAYFSRVGQTFHFPLSALSWFLSSLVLAWISYKVWHKEHSKEDERLFKDFSFFFLFYAIFLGVIALPHLILFLPHHNHYLFSQLFHWAFVIGHVFLYLGIAFFIRIPLSFIAPRFKNLGFKFFLLFGIFITGVNIVFPNQPEFIHNTGITAVGADSLVATLIAILGFLAWVPPAIYFLFQGVKTRDRFVRHRAFFLAIGLILATIGGPLHDMSKTALVYLLADMIHFLGIVSMGAAAFVSEVNVENTT